MIIRVPITQIEDYWEVIKFASVNAENIKKENIRNYCINLLFGILNERFIPLISFDEYRKIHRILIISFIFDPEINSKCMFFKVLYGFEHGTADSWFAESQKIYEYAKKENCRYITASTSNPRIEELAEKYGFKKISSNYQIIL